MDFKTLAKYLLPPVLVDLFRQIASPYYNIGHLWKGVYDAFDEVHQSGEGYEGEVWMNSRIAQVAQLLEDLDHGGAIPINLGFRYASLGLLASIVLKSKKSVRILDFGGALGIAYPQVLKSIVSPTGKIEFFVVDSDRSGKEGKRLFLSDHRIRFYSSLTKEIPEVDIVFISGVLQYIENYEDMLLTLAAYNPTYFLLTFLSAGDIPPFVSAQRNLKKSVLPSWFINVTQLVGAMNRIGYDLLYKVSIEPEDRLDMSNFPKQYRLHHMANLLFHRKLSKV